MYQILDTILEEFLAGGGIGCPKDVKTNYHGQGVENHWNKSICMVRIRILFSRLRLHPFNFLCCLVVHAGRAAILDALMNHTGEELQNSTLYVTLFPDNIDAQHIREVGIKEVVYLDNKFRKRNFTKASRQILEGLSIRWA